MSEIIEINKINAARILVPIVGTAPLLIHRFSEKAKIAMLDAMQGRKSPKQRKDPEAEYQASLYLTADGRAGFPSVGFKAATVSAARFFHGITMTALRQQIFFQGVQGVDGQKLVIIEGQHKSREDVVRVKNGGTDLRYRAEFPEWKATLEIVYVTSILTEDSLLTLIDAGGMGVGVGEWRPEKRGDFGTFALDRDRGVEHIG